MARKRPRKILPDERVVRVFISSTFRDMQAERDELVKRTFPQLRKLCEQRGVAWSEVDLRWGITAEQSERGEVLPICLAEIQRCRPYFIGLLGERYGWVPDEIPAELIEQEPWLAEHLQQSVTELEILHGVLNDPVMADHTLFYFRDRGFVDSLPREQQMEFLELASQEEIARFGQVEAERRAAGRKRKLAKLKAQIRVSGFPVREDYPNPQALGEMVLADLTEIINRLYPQGSEPEPLDREALDHNAFAHSRAKVYIGRQSYLDRLDEHAGSDGPPLVVVGESGSGKSALLSNWALRYRDASGGEALICHFIGATPYSADWMLMLRRILGELKRRFEIQEEIPDRADQLRAAFANWLHRAAAKGRVVLILDALNQLEDRDGAQELLWLPPVIPPNIRLIVSALPSRALDELDNRGWPKLPIAPLHPRERLKLLWKYLRQYSKRLNKRSRRRIAAAEQSANPLYLRALLDELRIFGSHEELKARIEHYLNAATGDTLYEKILKRYEQDYERDAAGLVRAAMSFLWAARRGLSETELLELLGDSNGPLPRAYWSPLYLAAEASMTSRSGRISFVHDYLRQAVEHRYLRTESDLKAVHLKLADYFAAAGPGQRKVDELPWQLAEAGSWQRLATLLADPPFLFEAWKSDEYQVKTYWARIERESDVRVLDTYRGVIESPQDFPHIHLFHLTMLLNDAGHRAEAERLQLLLIDYYRESGERRLLHLMLNNRAVELHARGLLAEARSLLQEVEEICEQLGDTHGRLRAMSNQAVILSDRGELDRSLSLRQHVERISLETGDLESLQSALGGQALIRFDRGEWSAALELFRKQQRICQETGHKHDLSICLGNQGSVLEAIGEYDAALEIFRDQERVRRDLGDRSELAHTFGQQANVLVALGRLDEAWSLLKEKESICRGLGETVGVADALLGEGVVLETRGDLNAAWELYVEAEESFRSSGVTERAMQALGNRANVLFRRGDLEGALGLQRERDQFFRGLGLRDRLQACLGNQAMILMKRGDLPGALDLAREQEQICRELGNRLALQACLGTMASIAKQRGDLHTARTLLEEREQICRSLRHKKALADCLGQRVSVVFADDDFESALRLSQESEALSRDLGDERALADALGHQALLCHKLGQRDRAARVYREAERLCRRLDYKSALQSCLNNHALLLKEDADFEGASRLFEEQERICRDLAQPEPLAICLANRAGLLAELGRASAGLALANEAYRIATGYGLVVVAGQIEEMIEYVRSRLTWRERILGSR